MNDFNLTLSSLDGTHSISAGAGTGKTYTICHLFLRLLLEKSLSVDSILVVTFTEAATEELRDRIRKLISLALHITYEENCDDPVNSIVHSHIENHSLEYTRAVLYSALNAFDEASVCTIHSFCQRILKENAFESGMRFDTELIVDQESMILETVQDFWRNRFYAASPYLVNYIREQGLTPQDLFKLVHGNLSLPDMKIIPKPVYKDTSRAEELFANAFAEVEKAWPGSREEIADILLNSSSLNRNRYREKDIQSLINRLDIFLLYGRYWPDLFKGFIKFTEREIINSTKKNMPPENHRFFGLCDRLFEQSQNLCSLSEQRILAFKYEIFDYVRDHLFIKKQQNNVYTFDDLLINLYNAVRGSSMEIMIKSIRKKIRAALIDEFQDTDPVQYAIFRSLFADCDIPLFLIGDPKQAIFSFRGADIFTFLEAVKNTKGENIHTLSTNRRSGKSLITAFNTVFNSINAPFVYEGIPYFTAQEPPSTDASCSVTVDDAPSVPMKIWYFPASCFSSRTKKDGTYYPINKAEATDILCKAVKNEIINLITRGKFVKEKSKEPITPGDIAVLVRTRDQAAYMKEVLSAAQITSVLHNTGNIFDTEEAGEINQFLHAVVYPDNSGFIKAALSGSTFGLNANDLCDYSNKDSEIEKYYDEFREYHNIWARYGFIRMFASFINRRHVRKRILSSPRRERGITNILHIQDILQQQITQNRFTMVQLLKWFSTQINPESPRIEEHELRLEKDDNAVQIVTIHRAKGLEYPIVFSPFTWGSSSVSGNEFIFHDKHNTRIYDIGSEESEGNKACAEKEILAENLRLLYVSITRAKYQCYLVWGEFSKSESSAPAYLFHRPESWNEKSTVSDLADYVKSLREKDMLDKLNRLADISNETIEINSFTDIPEISYNPVTDSGSKLSCRVFKGIIQTGKRLCSFSSLIHKKHETAEFSGWEKQYFEDTDIPRQTDQDTLQEEQKSIYTFPGGITTGLFFHDILEHLDFKESRPDIIKSLISSKLTVYGFDRSWHDTIHKTVENLVSVNLRDNETCIKLSSIPMESSCREMEFYYPIKNISSQKLAAVFRESGCTDSVPEFPESIESLDFQPSRGFMHGFIDLLFTHNNRYYIVDWKTNFLGDSIEFYSEDCIMQAMFENTYFLQYYIYSLAVDLYLSSCIKNYSCQNNFGGVFYIFLRGISEDHDSTKGIFFDKPKPELIEILRREIII